MKSFKEMLLEKNIVRGVKQGDWSQPYFDNEKSYIDKVGAKVLGVFALKGQPTKYRFMIDLFENEKNSYKYNKKELNSNEVIIRYVSETTASGGMAPIIKMNLSKGLVYFIDEDAMEAEGDRDYLIFEKKGEKVEFIRTSL